MWMWTIDSSGQYVAVDVAQAISIASLAGVWQRLSTSAIDGSRFTTESESWLASAERELDEFAHLPSGWDTYNAPPVRQADVDAAKQLVKSLAAENIARPTITVTARGHLQFEWHTHQKDIEIELMGPEQYSILYDEAATAASWEGTVSGVGALRMIFDQLRVR
jgi:hypothetical protein